MERSVEVILLAGSIQPPPLRQATDRAVAALPLTEGVTVLECWLEVIATLPPCRGVRVVVNSDDDAEELTRITSRELAPSMAGLKIAMDRDLLPPSRVMLEPASWRGTAGLVRDVAEQFDGETQVLIIEANMLPPVSLRPLAEAFDEVVTGVIGATESDEPNGTYLFRRDILEHIPRVGYFDLKEQLLPRLHGRGLRVRAARFTDPIVRLQDRSAYLRAARLMAARMESDWATRLRDRMPQVRFEGPSIVEEGVRIEPGAIVHESVLLSGSTIEAGAVVSRCVVASGAVISAESTFVDEVISPRDEARFAMFNERRKRAG